ncbi:MAG: helix-turn-helix domain-containing protein [Rhizobiales bacterium]|nr:helix-turn-helix domain-containing protein [Hyphomicrobiales bacterium]
MLPSVGHLAQPYIRLPRRRLTLGAKKWPNPIPNLPLEKTSFGPMSITIPLIRGFALFPALSWFARHGVPVEDALRRADLPQDLPSCPYRPVPLVLVASLLRTAAYEAGPDLPCRIVFEADNLELAFLGKVALGSETPREALAHIIPALPFYCSHEQVSVERKGNTTIVREFFSHRFDAATNHFLLQYAAAMVHRICGLDGRARLRFARIELPPHPEFGLKHLGQWFGAGLVETRSNGFSITVDNQMMDRRFNSVARPRTQGRPLLEQSPLRGDGSLSGSVRNFLVSMIECGQTPSIERLSAVAGISVRRFQRQLASEATSYSRLLAEVRHDEAQRRLHETDFTIAAIAAELGYSDQASLTRAFRRWTGRPPTHHRVQQS